MDQHSAMVPVFVGIDVAKDRLDVHLLPSREAFAVARDHAGLEQLVARLDQAKPVLVVLEATGGFEITVAAALSGVKLPLAVVNPRQIRDFARALGRLAKTDALDARRSRCSPNASGRSPGRWPTPRRSGWPSWSPAGARSSR
jgi:transposase